MVKRQPGSGRCAARRGKRRPIPFSGDGICSKHVNKSISVLPEQVLHVCFLKEVQHLQEHRGRRGHSFVDEHQDVIPRVQERLPSNHEIWFHLRVKLCDGVKVIIVLARNKNRAEFLLKTLIRLGAVSSSAALTAPEAPSKHKAL